MEFTEPFDLDRLTTKQEAQIHEKLGELAAKHAEGFIEVLEYKPDEYEFQHLRVTHQSGVPQSVNQVADYGRAAYARFDECVEEYASRPDLLKANRLITAMGKNLFIATDHSSNIIDIAVAGGAHYVAQQDPSLAHHNHIVVSKIITRLKAFGVPAVNILREFGHVWFSFPTTESMRQSGIDPEIAYACNQLMKHEFQPVLEQGHNTIAVAPPGRGGTVRRTRNGEVKKVTIHGLGSGTIDWLKGNPIQPVHIWMDTKNPLFEAEFPVFPEDEEAIHQLMQSFADRLQQHLGCEVDYERERSLLSRLGGVLLRKDEAY